MAVRTAKQRSLVGSHHAAVKRFVSPHGGDESVLRPFRNKIIDGKRLETDPAALEELWRIGELDYSEIYD